MLWNCNKARKIGGGSIGSSEVVFLNFKIIRGGYHLPTEQKEIDDINPRTHID